MADTSATRRVVPWVVVLVAIGLFWWTRRNPGKSPFPAVASDVTACRDDLRAIYTGLREYASRFGSAPAEPGDAFFLALITSGVWPDTAESRRLLTCPGRHARPATFDLAAGAASAFAGRDTKNHPLAKFPSGGAELEPLVACDNAAGMNHDGAMNVLYSDGSVRTFRLEDLIAAGKLPAGTTDIPVGPDSPLEDLRKLVVD